MDASRKNNINPFPERPKRKDHLVAYGFTTAAPASLKTTKAKAEEPSKGDEKQVVPSTAAITSVERKSSVVDLGGRRLSGRGLDANRRRRSLQFAADRAAMENSASSMGSGFSMASALSKSRTQPHLSPQKRRSLMRRKNKPEISFRISAAAPPPNSKGILVALTSSADHGKNIVLSISDHGKSKDQNEDSGQGQENIEAEVKQQIDHAEVPDPEQSLSNFNDEGDEESSPAASDHHDDDEEKLDDRFEAREYVSIHDDVYNLFMMGKLYGHSFYYSLYVFALKIALYTFLAWEVFQKKAELSHKHSAQMLAAQFLMLPIAVAMQDDLTATFYLIANVKYCKSIEEDFPEASRWKFDVATACRALDGCYSLIVNFVVLVSAPDILSLFLNFAALQFLQTIDNIALDLAADGYLTDKLEGVAVAVQQASLPKRRDANWLRSLDTVLYCGTVSVLISCWAFVAVWNY